MKAINTVILAAGEGTRLRPYTLNRPKCMVEINGKQIIQYQLDVLQSQQIDSIAIVTGYLSDMLQPFGLKTYVNNRYNETNMVWSLFCAKQEFKGTLVVSYGDIVYSKNIINDLIQSPHDISVVVDRKWASYWRERFSDPLDDAEILQCDQQGRIINIGQKPKTLNDIEGQYIGLMKFSEKGQKILQDTFKIAQKNGKLGNLPVEKAYMTDLLQAIIDNGHDIWPVNIEGGWIEIDTVKDLNSKITLNRLEEIIISCTSK